VLIVCCPVCLSCVLVCVQDEVLIAGFGRRGHAVGDIPGVRFKVRPPAAGQGVGGLAAGQLGKAAL
jgi:ribosomal protein S12